jgi:hypothetical protein
MFSIVLLMRERMGPILVVKIGIEKIQKMDNSDNNLLQPCKKIFVHKSHDWLLDQEAVTAIDLDMFSV